jgi:hypothetical protein
MQPSVWIVGDGEQAEFVAAIGWLQQSARCTTFECLDAVFAASRGNKLGDEPASVVFLESRSGEFCAGDVERLHAAFPLARLVSLVGPWCEGPQRANGRMQGVSRVRWSDWENRLAREMGLASDGDSMPPPLPRTMTVAERIDRDSLAVQSEICKGRRIAICTGSRASFQAIAEAADYLGYAAHWQSDRLATQMPDCDVVVHDGWDQANDPAATPRMLLLQFPRPEDFSRAASLGIGAVVAQPMLLSDFGGALLRLK